MDVKGGFHVNNSSVREVLGKFPEGFLSDHTQPSIVSEPSREEF